MKKRIQQVAINQDAQGNWVVWVKAVCSTYEEAEDLSFAFREAEIKDREKKEKEGGGE